MDGKYMWLGKLQIILCGICEGCLSVVLFVPFWAITI